MNIVATALSVFLDASAGGLSSAGPASGALTNIASTLLGGDGAGSSPLSDVANQLAGGALSSLIGEGLGGSIAGILA
jgi:hypothetical protein